MLFLMLLILITSLIVFGLVFETVAMVLTDSKDYARMSVRKKLLEKGFTEEQVQSILNKIESKCP